MSRHGQLQIHQRLDVRTVEMKDALAEIKQAEGGGDPDNAQHCGYPQHHVHVPGLGLVFVMNVVISDGQDCAVVEQRQHHDHHRSHRVKVKDQDRQGHEQQYAQRLGDAVDRIAVHALENFPALLYGIDDHRQSLRHQHDVGRSPRRVVRAGNGDAAVGLLKRGGVVHPIAGHADHVAALLQNIYDVELVFWEHLGESIRSFDGFR